MNISINLKSYFSLLLRQFWLLILAFALVVGYTWFTMERPKKPIYTAQSTMYVTNGMQENMVQYSTSYQYAAQALIQTCSVVIQSDRSTEQIRQKLEAEYPDITAAEIRSSIAVGSVSETEVMSITARSADKDKAIAIANATLEVVPAILKEVIKVGEANPLDFATYASSTNYPSMRTPILYGAVAAVGVAGILFLITLFDTRIKDEEELANDFGLTVIGEIPNFSRPAGRKYKYSYGRHAEPGDEAKED